MKLNKNTIETLKNFTEINPFIVLNPGSKQATLSPEKIIMAETELDQEFPVEFGVYDLSQFLSVVTSLDDPDVTFTDTTATINDGDILIEYLACGPNVGVRPPDSMNLPDPDFTFKLEADTLKRLMRAASSLGLGKFVIRARNGEVHGIVTNNRTGADGSNRATVKLGDLEDKSLDITVDFNRSNLVVLPGTYNVSVIDGMLGIFESEDGKRKYYISVESDESY